MNKTDHIDTYNRLTECIKNGVQKETKTKAPKTYPKKSWISKDTIKKSKRLLRLKDRQKKKYSCQRAEIIKEEKKELRKEIRKEKNEYYQRRLDTKDSKEIWKVINELLNRPEKNNTQITELEHNDKSITDKQTIADIANKFFCTIGEETIKQLKPTDINPTEMVEEIDYAPELPKINPIDIHIALDKINCKMSSGPDNIPNKVVKLLREEISLVITRIIQRIYEVGEVPNEMKQAKIKLLHKGGDHKQLKNYRPISMTNGLAKILDKVITKRLDDHMSNNRLWSKSQNAHIRGRSTESALADIVQAIETHIAEKKYTIGISLDVAKAYNCVNLDLLLEKLKKYKVGNKDLNVIKSFTRNRTQYTEIEDKRSEKYQIDYGVPQGSSIASYLYITMNNDLPKNTDFKVVMYSDDTFLIMADTDPGKLEQRVNDELERINNWFRANKLALNAKKTRYIAFEPQNKKYDFQLRIDNTDIERIGQRQKQKTFKLLGVTMTDNLDFKEHSEQVLGKMRGINYALNRTKKITDIPTRKLIYKGLIESHLNYCNIIWGRRINKKTLEQITRQQKRALRIVYGKKYNAHSDPLFIKSNSLKFKDMIEQKMATISHKAERDQLEWKLAEVMRELKEKNERRNTLRNNQKWNFRGRTTDNKDLLTLLAEYRNKYEDILDLHHSDFKFHVQQRIRIKYNTECTQVSCQECNPSEPITQNLNATSIITNHLPPDLDSMNEEEIKEAAKRFATALTERINKKQKKMPWYRKIR